MIWDISIALQILSTIKDTLAKTVNCKRHITDCCNHKITHATYGSTAYFQSNATSGTIKCFNMERYIKELVEIYTLKSKEELESLKKLIMNAHRAGEESIVIDKLTK